MIIECREEREDVWTGGIKKSISGKNLTSDPSPPAQSPTGVEMPHPHRSLVISHKAH